MIFVPSLGMKVWKYRWGRGGPWVLAAAASVNTAAEPGCREAFRWTHGVSVSPRLCQDAWGRGTAAGLPPCAAGPRLRNQGWRLIASCWDLWPGSGSSGRLRPTLQRNCGPGRPRRILLISEIQAKNLPKSWITPRNGFHLPGMESWHKAASSFFLLFSH